jgi:hypothetical protein
MATVNVVDNLFSYMKLFDLGSKSFVGFFETVSDILKKLGDEWIEHGKAEWGTVFHNSAKQILQVSKDLNKIKEEHDLENMTPESILEELNASLKEIKK